MIKDDFYDTWNWKYWLGFFIVVIVLVLLAFIFTGCSEFGRKEEIAYYNKIKAEDSVVNSLAVGAVFPDSLKHYLVEATTEFEKWKRHDKYFTLKNNKIVSIWRGI